MLLRLLPLIMYPGMASNSLRISSPYRLRSPVRRYILVFHLPFFLYLPNFLFFLFFNFFWLFPIPSFSSFSEVSLNNSLFHQRDFIIVFTSNFLYYLWYFLSFISSSLLSFVVLLHLKINYASFQASFLYRFLFTSLFFVLLNCFLPSFLENILFRKSHNFLFVQTTNSKESVLFFLQIKCNIFSIFIFYISRHDNQYRLILKSDKEQIYFSPFQQNKIFHFIADKYID